ncbi:MAG: DUF92 domain-containing protein [Chloroflexi bacterium]|nr:DUF92 domain-containing protein [Chloroflexota bacterium]
MFAKQIFLGMLFGGGAGFAARRMNALNLSGAWAAAIMGAVIFGFGGVSWALVTLTFFISSTMLSRIYAERKNDLSEIFEKGSQRDWGQVLANGGAGMILVTIQAVFPAQAWPWMAFLGAMATVNADTWATEIGLLSKSSPRLVTNGKLVQRGTSGGVTVLGTVATIAGGALVGLVVSILSPQIEYSMGMAVGALAGLAGSLLDSVLGATIQAIYYCPQDNTETEQHPIHRCGTATTSLRGWQWLNNDLVNFVSSIFGAVMAVGIWQLFE